MSDFYHSLLDQKLFSMFRRVIPFLFFFLLSACQPTARTEFELREGDLLFQDSDCGAFCEAIEAVTEGIDGEEYSHVGLVMQAEADSLRVMEATTAGVVFTPVSDFLARSQDAEGQPKVAVGRLKPPHRHLIPGAVAFIRTKKEAPYDFAFRIANDSFYCSELIHLAFQEANAGRPVFDTPPMTFQRPGTDTTFAVWQEYFEQHQLPIPEGEPGLNPGSMSRSPYLDIVHRYGQPER